MQPISYNNTFMKRNNNSNIYNLQVDSKSMQVGTSVFKYPVDEFKFSLSLA